MGKNILVKLKKKLIFTKDEFMTLLSSKSSIYICYLNPLNYFIYRKDFKLLESLSYIYIDGIFFTFLLSIFYSQRIQRLSFDINFLADDIFKYCIKHNKSVFFAGGTSSEIKVFIRKIRDIYGELNISGYCDGYKTDDEIIQKWIESGKSDLFLVGLGNKRQEYFVKKLKDLNEKVFAMSCGAFITQTANSQGISYYPELVYRFNLRWLYRILRDKKVFKRVVIYYPISLIFLIYDFLKWKFYDKS